MFCCVVALSRGKDEWFCTKCVFVGVLKYLNIGARQGGSFFLSVVFPVLHFSACFLKTQASISGGGGGVH